MKKTKSVLALAIAVTMLFSTACQSKDADENEEIEETTTATTVATTVNQYAEEIVPTLSTEEFVDQINVGWNLGNTLDAHNGKGGLDTETIWGNPVTKEKVFASVKKSGINTVRIPVSWGDHMDENYVIEEQWMDRVQEVVDYAVRNDLFIILNSHHEEDWRIPQPENEEEVTKQFTALWKQVAERFEPYGEKLMFEGMNEPRTVNTSAEWQGGTPEERVIINNLNQVFVDTVRASGGNNENRFLLVCSYGNFAGGQALKELVVPEGDRIIVTLHAYTPWTLTLGGIEKEFTENGKQQIDDLFATIDEELRSKGYEVIMGEICTADQDNLEERLKHTEYYFRKATEIGVPCIWWDTGSLFNRYVDILHTPEIVDAMFLGIDLEKPLTENFDLEEDEAETAETEASLTEETETAQ